MTAASVTWLYELTRGGPSPNMPFSPVPGLRWSPPAENGTPPCRGVRGRGDCSRNDGQSVFLAKWRRCRIPKDLKQGKGQTSDYESAGRVFESPRARHSRGQVQHRIYSHYTRSDNRGQVRGPVEAMNRQVEILLPTVTRPQGTVEMV